MQWSRRRSRTAIHLIFCFGAGRQRASAVTSCACSGIKEFPTSLRRVLDRPHQAFQFSSASTSASACCCSKAWPYQRSFSTGRSEDCREVRTSCWLLGIARDATTIRCLRRRESRQETRPFRQVKSVEQRGTTILWLPLAVVRSLNGIAHVGVSLHTERSKNLRVIRPHRQTIDTHGHLYQIMP